MNLITRIRSCTRCEGLPLGPRPIVQFSPTSKILIAGQAPGRITHGKGIPFDDPSGNRLREWLGLEREVFYDASKIAIVPMGFCFPGTGKGGDLPPREACAEHWREEVLASLPELGLTLVIGQYALKWHMEARGSVTEIVQAWRSFGSALMPLPHPSPRNNRWLKNNPWFDRDLLPDLKERVSKLLAH